MTKILIHFFRGEQCSIKGWLSYILQCQDEETSRKSDKDHDVLLSGQVLTIQVALDTSISTVDLGCSIAC